MNRDILNHLLRDKVIELIGYATAFIDDGIIDKHEHYKIFNYKEKLEYEIVDTRPMIFKDLFFNIENQNFEFLDCFTLGRNTVLSLLNEIKKTNDRELKFILVKDMFSKNLEFHSNNKIFNYITLENLQNETPPFGCECEECLV